MRQGLITDLGCVAHCCGPLRLRELVQSAPELPQTLSAQHPLGRDMSAKTLVQHPKHGSFARVIDRQADMPAFSRNRDPASVIAAKQTRDAQTRPGTNQTHWGLIRERFLLCPADLPKLARQQHGQCHSQSSEIVEDSQLVDTQKQTQGIDRKRPGAIGESNEIALHRGGDRQGG